MMSITVYLQAGKENCHRRNCNPSIRERLLEKLSGLLGFVKFCRFCSCFPETDDECGKLKLMKATLNLLAALFTLGAAEKQISETNFVREPGKSYAAEKRANSLTDFDFYGGFDQEETFKGRI